jgi:PAS domain S-box-containing protein
MRAGCLVIPVLAVAVLGAQTWTREHARAVEASRNYSTLVQGYAQRVIETQSLLLAQVNTLIPGDLQSEVERQEAHNVLSRLDDTFDFVLSVGVVDANGHLVVSSRRHPVDNDLSDRPYVRALRDSGEDLVLDRVTLRQGNEEAVIIAKRRPGEGFTGAVVSAVSVEAFTTFFDQVAQVEGASASLLRADGKLLVRHFPNARAITLPPDAPAMRAARAAPSGVYEALAISDGVNRIYGYAQVGNLPLFANYGFATRTIWVAWARTVVPVGVLLILAGALGFAVTTQTLRREAAEEKGRASDRLHRAFFTNMSDSLFVVGVHDDGFTLDDANPAHDRTSIMGRAEHRGRRIRDVFPPDVADVIEANYRRCIEAGGPVRFDEELDLGAGTRRWETVLAPVHNAEGRVTHVIGAARDVTERVELEDALRRSQKMEALSRLVSGVAHDFNNILQVVLGNLDLLRRAGEDRRPRLIDNAHRAAEQGRKITSQLLAFGRRQTLRPEVANVNALVAGMDDMLAQSLRGDIQLTFDLSDELWSAEVDVAQFQTALINVAANARDAMPAGGEFIVRTRNVVLGDGKRSEAVVVSLTDSGTGMPPEVLARVGEPFFSTKKESGAGNGLGMAQVFGFVQQSGGTVEVRSETGRGTTVTLSFPRAKADRVSATEKNRLEEVEARELAILLVEDNSHVAAVSVGTLEDLGHRVTLVTSADEAHALLRRDGAFDMVMSDMVMPGALDGLGLARALRSERPDLPVLLVTGYSAVAPQAEREGFAVLPKPYSRDDLVGAIARVAPRPKDGPGNLVRFPVHRIQ